MFVLFHIQNFYYIYSAAGEKLATNANGSLTYYRSVMVYGNDNKLLYILTPEGTVSRTEGSAGTSYTYNYFKKDQIGSTRAVLSAVGNSLQNVQSTDYYPFGLAYSTNNLNKNKYLFSGKELQDASIGETILGLYDFGARQYDPVIGRWMAQDPANQHASPYIYCSNNPIALIDPSGMKDTSIMIGGFTYWLREDEFGNYSFSIFGQIGRVEDRSGRDITDEVYQSLTSFLDLELQEFAFLRLGFKIGDYGIQGLTTKISGSYRYTSIGGLFTKGRGNILGYFDPEVSIAHIAPSLVYEKDDNWRASWKLLAVLTHELLHGVHHYYNGSDYNSVLSETACYEASCNIYLKGWLFNDMYQTYLTAQEAGYTLYENKTVLTNAFYPSHWVKPINYPKPWEFSDKTIFNQYF